jgi:hypothetical protein
MAETSPVLADPAAEPSIVHQDVDLAERFHGSGDHAVHVGLQGDIRADRQGAAAQRPAPRSLWGR